MKKTYLIVLFAWIIFMDTALSDTSYKQPLFSLEFNIYGTAAEILLNDIPVYYHDDEGRTLSQKPVPESIVDGENVLTVKSFPLEEGGREYRQGAYIEAIISVREKNAPLNDNKPLLQLKLNPANSDDKLLDGTLAEAGSKAATLLSHNDKQTIAERRTEIKSPFPRWAWQDGQIIEDTPENFNSLLKKYKEIWAALNDGDKDDVRKLYDPAAQEFAWAYHYQDKKKGHRLMNTAGFVGDSEWVLGNIEKLLDKRIYKIRVYGNGLIADVFDTQDKKSPIMYLNPNNGLISFQKFGFYKNKTGEWIMIR